MSALPQLLVADLDGTLLGGYEPYGRLPAPCGAFLDALADAGCHWACNSTWDLAGQWHLVLASPIRSRPRYLMADLGLSLWEVGSAGPRRVEPFCTEMAARLAPTAAVSLPACLRELMARFTPQQVTFNPHWLSFTCAPAEATAFQEYLAAADWAACGLRIYEREQNRASLVPDFLGKHLNLGAALQLAGLPPAAVVVAGDANADLAMMQPALAQHWLCPANAAAAVQAHVRQGGGAVGERRFSDGVRDAFATLARRHGWPGPERAVTPPAGG